MLSAIGASCFHKANKYGTLVQEVAYRVAIILNGNKSPLIGSPERFRQVNMRNDLCFHHTLMRQRRDDRTIYFLSGNRAGFLRLQ